MAVRNVSDLVKELVAEQLVVDEWPDGYSFRHTLTREAAYGSLLLSERKRYHRMIAETIERLDPGSDSPPGADQATRVTDLAYHYSAAEVWDKALEYSWRAGEQAQAMFAPREAIEQFHSALRAAEQLSQPRIERQLLLARGQAYETIGAFEQAQADYERSLELARAGVDRDGEWQALLDLGFLWAARDYDRAGSLFAQALDAARMLGDSHSFAHTLNRVGNWYVNIAQPQQGQQYHLQALTLFQQAADREGLAETFDLLGLASEEIGDMVQTAKYYDQAIALFRELDDRRGLSSSLALGAVTGENYFSNLCVVKSAPGTQATTALEEALRLAQGTSWRAGECFALSALSMCWGISGEYGRALDAAQQGLALAQEIEHWQWTSVAHGSLGLIYDDLLALEQAHRELHESLTLARKVRSVLFILLGSGRLASVLVQENDLTQAERILAGAFGLPEGTPLNIGQVRVDDLSRTVAGRSCLTALAELEFARGDAMQTLDMATLLAKTAPNFDDAVVIPRLWKLRGEALIALGRYAEAETVLVAAREAAQARGLRPMQWRLHKVLGKLYHVQARRQEADEEKAAARAVIGELAAEIDDKTLREQFSTAAVEM